MPLWVLLDLKSNGKVGIWKSNDPFPNGIGRYTFPGSSVEGGSVPQALRALAKELEKKPDSK